MATITIPAEDRRITDREEIAQHLAPVGIWHECWPVEGRVGAEASSDEILAAYAPEIERLKERGAFVTADVINVSPDTPNLDAMLAKFDKEHTHSEDEVRFTVAGRGVFWINPVDGPVFSIEVEAGDLINVPAGTRHWFHLCTNRSIRCIRLFEDASGWTPEYAEEGVDGAYAPVCWGPEYVTQDRISTPAIEL